MTYKIQRFDKAKHPRRGFHCEEPALTDYLKKQLTQDEKRNISKGYVMVKADEPKPKVMGYYTLTAFSFRLDPDDLQAIQAQTQIKDFAKIPANLPAPAVLIGRLARHSSIKRIKAGERLLMDALRRILTLSDQYAVHFVIVDAIGDHAKAFYKRFGFLEFGRVKDRMYLPIKVIEQATT